MTQSRIDRRNFLTTALATSAASSLLAARTSASARTSRFAPSAVPGVRPQILVFDTFGTVVDWRSSVIAEGDRLGRAKGLNVDWAAFADAWRGGYGPSMNRVRSGALPWTKLDVLHRMTLDELLVRFKITNLTEDEKAHL